MKRFSVLLNLSVTFDPCEMFLHHAEIVLKSFSLSAEGQNLKSHIDYGYFITFMSWFRLTVNQKVTSPPVIKT